VHTDNELSKSWRIIFDCGSFFLFYLGLQFQPQKNFYHDGDQPTTSQNESGTLALNIQALIQEIISQGFSYIDHPYKLIKLLHYHLI